MTQALVVVRPFAGHARGTLISDAPTITAILAGENAACVVRVMLPTPGTPSAATPAAAPQHGS